MILYRHPSSVRPPPWLAGAANLMHREDRGMGFVFGLGEPYEFGIFPPGASALADGWECALVGDLDSRRLQRRMAGQPVVEAYDMHGRPWAAPMMMAVDGSRAFQVSYGPGFLPRLTAAQAELFDFAAHAKAELPRLIGDPAARVELMPTACAWAARALAYVNHVTPEVVEQLGLLDEELVAGVLVTLTSYNVGMAADHG